MSQSKVGGEEMLTGQHIRELTFQDNGNGTFRVIRVQDNTWEEAERVHMEMATHFLKEWVSGNPLPEMKQPKRKALA